MGPINLSNLSYEALQRYFTRLHQFGYMNYNNVEQLIVFLYIQEILSDNELEQDELAVVEKALDCIQGNSCLIPNTWCDRVCI